MFLMAHSETALTIERYPMSKVRKMSDIEALCLYVDFHAMLRHEPETGKLFWVKSPSHAVKAGHEAKARTTPKSNGLTYIRVRLHGVEYLAHHVIWLMYYGKWPALDIDHINGDGTDNRLSNLREATTETNGQNQSKHVDNRSGFCGVGLHQGKWRARIVVSQTEIDLGYFHTRELAIEARKKANMEYGFHANHGR